jgi:hypothetical protein
VSRTGRLLLIMTGAALEYGCASFVRGSPVAWSCVSEVATADVKASAFYNVDRNGHPFNQGVDWGWNTSDRDFSVTMATLQSRPIGVPPMVTFVIDMPKELSRRKVRAELRASAVDQPQTDSRFVDGRYGERQYNINVPMADFEALATSGAMYVVAVDSSGAVLRAVKLDVGAIARGETAMHSAQDRAASMTSNFRQLCTPEYAGDSVVIA